MEEESHVLGIPPILHNFIYHENNLSLLVRYVQSVDETVRAEDISRSPIIFANRYVYSLGRPAYVNRIGGFGIREAVDLASAMNCKLFIAHPGGEFGYLEQRVIDFYIRQGIHGIEVRNYFNSPEQNARFDAIAKQHSLIRSGGSDFHGKNGKSTIGIYDRHTNQLPAEIAEELFDNLPS